MSGAADATSCEIEGKETMRAFFAACLAAAIIALCAVVVLNRVQKPVETAFSTSAVRI
jgi:hypothetical protein